MYLLPELSESTKYVDLPAFHEIRRKALGFDNARHIVVRLWKDCNHQVVRFCLHLHHVDAPVNHTPWVMTKGQPPPCRSFCGPPNRLIHQLNRFVWGYFEDGVNRNANVMFWDMLDDFLRDIHHRCVCCGTELGTGNSLLRSAACSRACSIGVRSSELEVRCPELGFDRDGAYGLVIAAKHAIEKRHYDHIQPLPLRLSEQVIEYRLSVNHSSLWTIVTSPTLWDSDTKVLIAWILTGYRGCFVSTQRSDMELMFSWSTQNQKLKNRLQEQYSLGATHRSCTMSLHSIACIRFCGKGYKYYPILVWNNTVSSMGREFTPQGKVVLLRDTLSSPNSHHYGFKISYSWSAS
jgi:hypothetical protein